MALLTPVPPAGSLDADHALATVEAAVHDLQSVVHALWPRSLSGDEARRLVDALARGERAVASGIALLTPRVVETGAHAKEGHGTPPIGWPRSRAPRRAWPKRGWRRPKRRWPTRG